MLRSLVLAFVLGAAGAITGLVLSNTAPMNRAPEFTAYLLPYIVGSALAIVGGVAGAANAIVHAITEVAKPPGGRPFRFTPPA